MRVLLYDELPSDYADIDRMPQMWCAECRKRTSYRYDQFDTRECQECNEEEVCHADEA